MVGSIALFGVGGSIGQQTLAVCAEQAVDIPYMASLRDSAVLYRAIERFQPRIVALADPQAAERLREALSGQQTEVWAGEQAICDLARLPVERMVMAISGFAALRPLLSALAVGRSVALANKESLVVAGHLVRRLLETHGGEILPVDSEHSAIFQCLQAVQPGDCVRLIITASGGAFRHRPAEDLARVTAAEALAHPNWAMGPKITIDSATLVNKGLEVIEAHHLFQLPFSAIEAVQHEESIVHSMIELRDGAVLAQLGTADMRLPIQFALSYPERAELSGPRLDFKTLGALHFAPLDEERFPAFRLCLQAGERGPGATTALNAANEVAVAAFLAGRIPFTAIPTLLRVALETLPADDSLTEWDLDAIMLRDRAVRVATEERIGQLQF